MKPIFLFLRVLVAVFFATLITYSQPNSGPFPVGGGGGGGGVTNGGAGLTNVPGTFIDPTQAPYNAAGDGVTDDTIALTNAFWSASISNKPVLLSKKFLFSSQLVFYTNTTIFGYGGTLKCAAGTSFPSGRATTTGLTSTNIHLMGLEVDGGNALSIPGSDDGRTGLLIFATENANCSVDHLYIHGFGKGLYVFDVGANVDPQISINTCILRNNWAGLHTENGAEYISYSGMIVQENHFGATIGTGNDHFTGGSFDRNVVNLIIDGTGAVNIAHGQFIGTSFNHAQAWALQATNVLLGEMFVGCSFLPPNIYLTNCQGFTFSACAVGWNVTNFATIYLNTATNICFTGMQNPYTITNAYAINSATNCQNIVVQYPVGLNVDISGNITASNLVAITQTNDNAAAGFLGEYFSGLLAVGSASGLSTTVASNVLSLNLTAGDWDVMANLNITTTSATMTASSAGLSTTSATLPTDGSEVNSGVQVTLVSEKNSITLPRKRVSVSGNTTVYLVGSATFSAGTVAVYGQINARRVR